MLLFEIPDARKVSSYYLIFSLFSGLVGFGFSYLIRCELVLPYSLYGEEFYYVAVTSHAIVMVFFFLTSLGNAFFNFVGPALFRRFDFFFPKLNIIGFLLVVVSFVFLLFSLFFGYGVATGWTAYVPLSSKGFSSSYSVDFFVLSVHIFSLSSLVSSVNFLCTVYHCRKKCKPWLRLSVFIWSIIITSCLNIISLPSLSLAVTMLFLDRNFGCTFFNSSFGGDSILYQTLFWFWGHPEVYILILPVFGLVTVLCCFYTGRKRIFGHESVVVSIISIGLLGLVVWGHHMVTVGWNIDVRSFFMAATMVISIPTGVKMFNWIVTLCFYKKSISYKCLGFYYVYCFILLFLVGGVSGIMLSNAIADVILHDTYFVVGHFHYVLSTAAVSGYLGGFSEFWHLFISIVYKFRFDFGITSVFVFFFGSNVLFFPMFVLGINGVSRRCSCYSDSSFFMFYISSVGFLMLLYFVDRLIFSILMSFFVEKPKRKGCNVFLNPSAVPDKDYSRAAGNYTSLDIFLWPYLEFYWKFRDRVRFQVRLIVSNLLPVVIYVNTRYEKSSFLCFIVSFFFVFFFVDFYFGLDLLMNSDFLFFNFIDLLVVSFLFLLYSSLFVEDKRVIVLFLFVLLYLVFFLLIGLL